MPGPRDADNIIRTGATNLTNTENLTYTLTAGVAHTSPMALNVLVPQASSGDSLKVTAKFTTAGKKIEVTHTDEIDDNTAYPFLLRLPLPFTTSPDLAVDLVVTGGPGNFGAVQAWLERAENAKVDA